MASKLCASFWSVLMTSAGVTFRIRHCSRNALSTHGQLVYRRAGVSSESLVSALRGILLSSTRDRHPCTAIRCRRQSNVSRSSKASSNAQGAEGTAENDFHHDKCCLNWSSAPAELATCAQVKVALCQLAVSPDKDMNIQKAQKAIKVCMQTTRIALLCT